MRSQWSDAEAAAFADDPVALRAYSSRLLGREPGLVLHGGGNTSVKVRERDFFGDEQEVLYVKGSGWDLASIEPAGFAPVRMELLLRLAALPALSDTDMVRLQRTAMTDPGAPNPSVEAILHALIPSRYVDHTHADAVVALSNTPDGQARLRALYGERVLVVPYVMPGFVLARQVFELTRDVDWGRLEGLVLMHHGVFTFADDARQSYERMIALVDEAERRLEAEGALGATAAAEVASWDPLWLATLRREVARAWGRPVLARLDERPQAVGFSRRDDAATLARGGTVTPDHVLHMKPWPLIVGESEPEGEVAAFGEAYRAYFGRHATAGHAALDPAPRWAVWPGAGLVAFGPSPARLRVVRDVAWHTVRAMQWAKALGGWRPVSEAELFEVEYWELEQAKLGKGGARPPLEGKAALVTGAASGIGRATVHALRAQGAAVAALDRDPGVAEAFGGDVLALVADLSDAGAVEAALDRVVASFGGLDVLVSNAGTFPAGAPIEALGDEAWRTTLEANLTTHQRVLRAAAPLLKLGLDPAVVVVASKNVPAPGPGAAAYSVAKAGLTQLARVAALELAPAGVRVNVVHPDAVFDTGIWPAERIAERAARYGLTPEQYKTRNLMGVEIGSADVAALVAAMVGPAFAKTTGAQVPIDGGSDRVI